MKSFEHITPPIEFGAGQEAVPTGCAAFPTELTIGNRKVGVGHPTYVVAEIGANFDHNIDKAKALIRAAKDAGAAQARSGPADRDRLCRVRIQAPLGRVLPVAGAAPS